MKTILITLIIAIGLSACSGEFYELKKSPCACIDDDVNQNTINIRNLAINID